jgi:hypothetical protein
VADDRSSTHLGCSRNARIRISALLSDTSRDTE